jgi:glycosyltransferase involved in cell wall biosynthesis
MIPPEGPGEVDVSVILCIHNGSATMRTQLDALVSQQWDRPWDIVVVDHASTDETAWIASAYQARDRRVQVIAAPAGGGLSRARNVGVAHARGRSVVFCDDDDRVEAGWVAAMGEALDHHPLIGSRLAYDEFDAGAEQTGRSAYQGERIEEIFDLPALNGGGSGWHRDLWTALGGNDEALDFTGEDHDMSIRAFLHEGVTPRFVPEAVYHYRRRSGVRATWRQARRYGRAHVWLYRAYGRNRGAGAPAPGMVARQWAWLVKHLPDLAVRSRRTAWAWRAGLRLGRLDGSIRERTWYP